MSGVYSLKLERYDISTENAYNNSAFVQTDGESSIEKDIKKCHCHVNETYNRNKGEVVDKNVAPLEYNEDTDRRDDYTDGKCLDREEDEDTYNKNCFTAMMLKIQIAISTCLHSYRYTIRVVFLCIVLMMYALFLGYAMYYEFGNEESIRLLWMSCLAAFGSTVYMMRRLWPSEKTNAFCVAVYGLRHKHKRILKWLFVSVVVVAISAFLIIDVVLKRPRNLTALGGMIFFIFLMLVFSHNPVKVNWRTVIWGLLLQFIFGLIVLRTSWGYTAINWLAERITEFLDYSDTGAEFVFGVNFMDHFFAMKVTSLVVFFSSVISILYYLGVMQWVISGLAWALQGTLCTSAGESLIAASNIFVDGTASAILIRPRIPSMTKSELHAVMTCGLASIAGSVLAIYILIGIPANHLLTAAVMSAPCSLAIAKLFYPESSRKTNQEDLDLYWQETSDRNILDAVTRGASNSIAVCATMVVSLIAFISLLDFFNTTLRWMGHRIGLYSPEYPELSFQFICSYVLWIFAFAMGVDTADCRRVAQLIGTKVFINEFVAFSELGVFINNTNTFNSYNGTWESINDDIYLKDVDIVLKGGIMEKRSIVISTYALCGFANFGSVGMLIGILGSMAPNRTADISSVAIRSLIAGVVTSWMTACTAALLYQDV